MTDERLTEQQIETLALTWPWEYEQSEAALRLAEREGWPLDDTVRALDVLAQTFGDESEPVETIKQAIDYKRRQRAQRPRYER